MIFFKRFFESYYLMLIKQRRSKFLRRYSSRTEDFSAMILVLIVQLFIIASLVLILKNIFNVHIPSLPKKTFSLPKLGVLFVFATWLFLGNKYFLSNRERRNKFIEDFRKLEANRKIFWNVTAIFFLFTPVWIFLCILIRNKF